MAAIRATHEGEAEGEAEGGEEYCAEARDSNEQSQIIAALVLDHGGTISGETWDTVYATKQFCPYTKASRQDGIVIELSEIEAT